MYINEKVNCENCDGRLNVDDTLYDEQTEVYFCDHGCFEEWADEHFDDIVSHYKEFYVYAG